MNRMAPLLPACCLGAALLLCASCTPDPQEITFDVAVVQWASPETPSTGTEVYLEEQRLQNGVLNSFFTEVDHATTDAAGHVQLETVRSNVLSVRVRVEREACFDEVVSFNPEDLITDTPNEVTVAVMPQAQVTASVDNLDPECAWDNLLYRWIPREISGAASDVRWTCETEWQAVSPGDVDHVTCYITGDTWLLHQRFWSCLDSTHLDSVWCPMGESIQLSLD